MVHTPQLVSTEIAEEDLANAYTDEYGVKYSQDRTRLLYATDDLTEYTIPQGTKAICDEAFWDYDSLTSISIPNSVTSIGNMAFFRCKSLTSQGVVSNSPYIQVFEGGIICKDRLIHAFHDQTSINIPNSVTSIGNSAFSDCKNLTSIYIPNSITSIDNSAFSGCYNLTSINIPNSVSSISDGAFFLCDSLTSINIPDSVTSIGDRAFFLCDSLTSINIPNSVTSIGNGAFSGCKSLTSISIPNSVTNIGNRAFSYSESLRSISIPNSVTSIGESVFTHCKSLTNQGVVSNSPHIQVFEGGIIFKDRLIHAFHNQTSINIPNSVTNIGGSAFASCESLTSIYIERGSREKFEQMLPSRLHQYLIEQ